MRARPAGPVSTARSVTFRPRGQSTRPRLPAPARADGSSPPAAGLRARALRAARVPGAVACAPASSAAPPVARFAAVLRAGAFFLAAPVLRAWLATARAVLRAVFFTARTVFLAALRGLAFFVVFNGVDSTSSSRSACCRFTAQTDHRCPCLAAQRVHLRAVLLDRDDVLRVRPSQRRDGQGGTRVRVELLGKQATWQLVRDGPVDYLLGGRQVGLGLRGGDVPLRQPHGAHEPGVAGHEPVSCSTWK